MRIYTVTSTTFTHYEVSADYKGDEYRIGTGSGGTLIVEKKTPNDVTEIVAIYSTGTYICTSREFFDSGKQKIKIDSEIRGQPRLVKFEDYLYFAIDTTCGKTVLIPHV